MAFIPVSFIFEVVLLFAGFLLMDRGLPSRALAIGTFIMEIPLVANRQVYVIENAGVLTTLQIFYPVQIIGTVSFFFILISYVAVANLWEMRGRDILGRKLSARTD